MRLAVKKHPRSRCCDRFQPSGRIGRQPALSEFLEAVGQPAFKKAAVVGWRLGAEQLPPAPLQAIGWGRFQGRDLR